MSHRVPTPGPAPAYGAGPGRRPAAAVARQGLRENAPQFALLVLVNALVGAVLGQQQAVLPLLAQQQFAVTGSAFVFAHVAAFGLAKAAANMVAGSLGDRFGRRPVLLAGWLVTLPSPALVALAPSWAWVLATSLLLGVGQGLTWSTTVTMKVDLVGPRRRGLAMGLNEAAGYGAVGLASLAAGQLASTHGLRPAPFLLGVALAIVGLALSAVLVRETSGSARAEAAPTPLGATRAASSMSSWQVFTQTSWREPATATACQVGAVNNLMVGLTWVALPLLFSAAGLGVGTVAALVAVHPVVWGASQLATGALADRWGRRPLVVAGTAVQALSLALLAVGSGVAAWASASALLGLGTAMVYPSLLAVVADVAHPAQRARALGTYRLWRDLGYVAGALVGASAVGALGLRAGLWAAALLSVVSAVTAAARLRETHPDAGSRRTCPAP